jgi:hypothetical protein
LYILIKGLLHGKIGIYQWAAVISGERNKEPVRFWILVFLVALLAMAMAISTIGQLLR